MATHPIDGAVFGRLGGDTTLMAWAVGGINRDIAPDGTAERFVIVKLQSGPPTHAHGVTRPVLERRYSIDAVVKGTSGLVAQDMADRIDALIDRSQGAAVLTAAGWTFMHQECEDMFGYTEADGDDRWQHRGGIYRVQAAKN